MDQTLSSSTSVLQTLLKTNRPPTDEERVIIQESMAPANAELKAVKEQISEIMDNIKALKSQLERAEIELQRLSEKEVAILETTADLRGAISSFRDMPEDVLREIFLAFMGDDIPQLYPRSVPLQYTLMQISSGIRHIALTTPSIWASISIRIDRFDRLDELHYGNLVFEARKWFERAGGQALSISVEDLSSGHEYELDGRVDPANILLDFLLSYSRRWKSIRFWCSETPTMITRMAALSAADVPLLRSVSLRFGSDTSVFYNSTVLSVPTLEQLTLITFWNRAANFTVNWALLTSLTLCGYSYGALDLSIATIAMILQQTKRLSFCDITVCQPLDSGVNFPSKIDLPFLKILHISDGMGAIECSAVLDLFHTPTLEIFHLNGIFTESISTFLKRSPTVQELSLCYSNYGKSLVDIAESLHNCPSLTVLRFQPHWSIRSNYDSLDANKFLKTFSQDDDVVPCPRLKYFTFQGSIDISIQTMRQFLECKQSGIGTRNSFHPWKRVTIDLKGVFDLHVRQEILDMFSQKQKEGLNVSVFEKEIVVA